ncbi:hypothetical protein GCM10027591_11300 [Zhihengliuella somnathii]
MTPRYENSGPPRPALNLTNSRDILAAAPHLLGFEPHNSLLLMLLSDNTLIATLRVDLPVLAPRETLTPEDAFTAASRVRYLVDPVTDVDRVLLIAYGEPEPGEWMAYGDLIEEVSLCLALSNVDVAGAWYVGGGFWKHYDCPRERCCPRGGRSVTELETAEVNIDFTLMGSAPKNGLWDGSNPDVWPDRERVRGIAAEYSSGLRPRLTIKALLRRWNGLVGRPAEEALNELRRDPELAGSLVGSLPRLQARNMVLALAAGALELKDIPLESGDLGYVPRTWGEEAGESETVVFRSFGFIMGTLHIAPDWGRLDQLWDVAYGLLPATEGDDRSALLMLMSWLEWARGRSSAADQLLQSSGGLGRKDQLASLVEAKLREGVLPNWVQDPQRAWRGSPLRAAA